MFYRLAVLSEKLFDVQKEGEHFMSTAMYNKHVTLDTHTHSLSKKYNGKMSIRSFI